jgi:hypothetical protein
MGGVFNTVNLHVYHYAGNNPVVLSDPDGRIDIKKILGGLLSIAGSAGVVVVTLGEDVATGGIGLINDPASLALAGTLFVIGQNLIKDGISVTTTPNASVGPTVSQANPKPEREMKPDNAPTGTLPINDAGLDREKVHQIKDKLGLGPKDWTGITPDGDVIVNDGEGNVENLGQYTDYLP